MSAGRGRLAGGRRGRRGGVGAAGLSAPPLVAAAPERRTGWFVLAGVVALVAVFVGLVGATPLVGGQYDAVFGSGAASVALLAAGVAARLGRRAGRRAVVGLLVACGVSGVLFLWGASSQVVVDGVPRLAVSETARSYRLAEQLLDDLYRMSEFDVLLSYDDATARANLREFDPAAEQLETIAARWATTEIVSLPDGRFGPILRHVYTSADFGAQALRAKRSLTLQYDPRTAAAVDSYRATYIRELLTAGPLLAELATEMGFDLVPSEGGLVE